MKANSLIKQHRRCRELENELSINKQKLFNLIQPYIENDLDSIVEDDMCIEYFSGDGFAFMWDTRGVPVDEIIERISSLKKNEKIKLSELTAYL